MLIRRICILGGSGFVGRALANRLCAEGFEVRVLTRDRERHRHALILLPGMQLVEANVHDPSQLAEHFLGCDAVINLVGILNEAGRDGAGFRAVHVDLAEKIIDACRRTGIQRLLHMSALNADAQNGPSHYLRTKGEAEDKVHAAEGIRVTSFRPSVIFGPEDVFFNRFAALLRLTPFVFPLACAESRFAPVFIDDVIGAVTASLSDPGSYGKRLNFCGPRDYSLLELVRYTAHCIGVRRLIIPLPDPLARVQAFIFDVVPGKPFSTDNYLSAKVDSVCDCNDLERFGITPTPLESVVPIYLASRAVKTHYSRFRSQSRRNAGP